jgi:O-antigen ligase
MVCYQSFLTQLAIMKKYYSCWIEKNSWLLLLFLIVPGMLLSPDDYNITTFIASYSYLLVIALVLIYWLLNPSVIVQMVRYRGTQLFAVFLIYSLLSVFWSANGYTHSIPVVCIGTCALLTLCYLLTQYQPQKLLSVEKVLLGSGILCIILAMYKYGSGFSLHNLGKGRGLFVYHVYISWLSAVLLLLLLARKTQLSLVQCLLFCFFIACIILSAGRGGLLVFVCGYLCMIFRQETRYREKQVILCLLVPIILIAALYPLGFLKMINKGASSRVEIFQVHFQKATDTARHIAFGRGLNTNTDLVIKQKKLPHFHSLYLTLMYKGGVIGLCLYLAMLAYVLYQGLRIRDAQPWVYIAIGMSVALAVDASDFFVWPSPLMICFLIPLFLTLFSIPPKNTDYEITSPATPG